MNESKVNLNMISWKSTTLVSSAATSKSLSVMTLSSFTKTLLKKIDQLVKKLNESDFKLKSLVLAWYGGKNKLTL
jgi:hypothetical protein